MSTHPISPQQALFRIYRPLVLWFAAILVSVEVVGTAAIAQAGPVQFSFWLVIAGAAAKYWPLVAGIMLVSTNFRQFVTNGVTRREFIIAAAVFGLLVSAGFGVLVPVGHGLESAVLGLADQRAASYPVLHIGELPGEVGQVLPGSLAYLASGALIAAGFYRFRVWAGVALILPAAIPIGIAAAFLGISEFGAIVDRVPYWPALLASLLATAAAVVAFHHLMRDAPIRPATG